MIFEAPWHYTFNIKFGQFTIRHRGPVEYGDTTALATVLISLDEAQDERVAQMLASGPELRDSLAELYDFLKRLGAGGQMMDRAQMLLNRLGVTNV